MSNFLNGLTLIFVMAKLFGVITWSWWVVFTPTFVYILLFPVIMLMAIFIAVAEEHL